MLVDDDARVEVPCDLDDVRENAVLNLPALLEARPALRRPRAREPEPKPLRPDGIAADDDKTGRVRSERQVEADLPAGSVEPVELAPLSDRLVDARTFDVGAAGAN